MDIYGAKSGSRQGFASSAALKNAGVTWDDATLNRFIENPDSVAPNNAMKPYGGLPDAAARKQIVDYLKTAKISSMAMSTSAAYTRTAVVLHWVLVVLLLGQFSLGWYLGEVPRGTPDRTIYVNIHKSIGMTLGVLILFRLYWRLTHRAPELPLSMPAWERMAAHISHWLLYVCMVVMPLSGYLASNFSKWGVNFFNAIKLPPWGVENEAVYDALNGIHVFTSYLLIGLIVVHALAAIRHLIARDGVFRRMTFD